ncbi:hypothetical protein HUJ05_010966 [Dendroctonus ponderosae]|nr:hypothetical protein HUJ05_010966 [Dendroctonus ponderosae]
MLQSPVATSDLSLDQSLSSGVDMRSSAVRVAGDYTKRKNVLRMSTVKPCRSEFLIQAESGEEFADWVKTLQQQVAVSTEADLEQSGGGRQRAEPQAPPTGPAQSSHLSPQPANKNGKTSMVSRNRSPTGQSPVSKTRKPSSHNDSAIPTTSPKSKTWRGRVAKQFKKFNQGATSPTSPTAPEVYGSTFGIPIEHCIASNENGFLPRFVEVCTEIIDAKGLGVTGIYRVPGNNASITALSEEINRNFEEVPLEDAKWNDLHVVSSLLKSFLRKMPDSEAGSYVKEIINITTEERKHRKDKELDRHLTEEERLEQEQRRVKLLEADREMERMKERTKAERERRHMERALKRRHDEQHEYYKKFKAEPQVQASAGNPANRPSRLNRLLQVVTVSDGSEPDPDLEVESIKSLSDNEEEADGDRSEASSRSKSGSKEKSSRAQLEKEHYQRERDRYYREKQQLQLPQPYKQVNYAEQPFGGERVFVERKIEEVRVRHERKHKEDKSKEGSRSHSKEGLERHKRERPDEEKRASKTLADLRER